MFACRAHSPEQARRGAARRSTCAEAAQALGTAPRRDERRRSGRFPRTGVWHCCSLPPPLHRRLPKPLYAPPREWEPRPQKLIAPLCLAWCPLSPSAAVAQAATRRVKPRRAPRTRLGPITGRVALTRPGIPRRVRRLRPDSRTRTTTKESVRTSQHPPSPGAEAGPLCQCTVPPTAL